MRQQKDDKMENTENFNLKNARSPKYWTPGCPEELAYKAWRKNKLHTGSKQEPIE